MSNSQGTSRWGIGSALLFTGFVLFILALVVYASLQDVRLVEESYYEKGLDYQERLDRALRSRKLDPGLRIEHRHAQNEISLSFPVRPLAEETATGKITLIRPSNPDFDRVVMVRPDSAGQQVINLDGMVRGLWRIEIDWAIESDFYYDEKRFVIP